MSRACFLLHPSSPNHLPSTPFLPPLSPLLPPPPSPPPSPSPTPPPQWQCKQSSCVHARCATCFCDSVSVRGFARRRTARRRAALSGGGVLGSEGRRGRWSYKAKVARCSITFIDVRFVLELRCVLGLKASVKGDFGRMCEMPLYFFPRFMTRFAVSGTLHKLAFIMMFSVE